VIHFQARASFNNPRHLATANIDLFVDSGALMTLNNGISVSKTFTVSSGGTLNCSASVVSARHVHSQLRRHTGHRLDSRYQFLGLQRQHPDHDPSYSSAANYAYNGTHQVTGAACRPPSPASASTTARRHAQRHHDRQRALTLATVSCSPALTSLTSPPPVRSRRRRRQLRQRLMQQAFSAAAGQSLFLPIGDATEYAPVTLTNWTVTTAGSLSARTTPAITPACPARVWIPAAA